MENPPRKFEDKVSIIIPCKIIDQDVLKCVNACKALPNNVEIFVVDDNDCPGFPALKRNWAMQRATGDYLAFLDADAYPTEDWLNNAITYLKNGFVGVCGPGILPPHSPILEQAADLVFKYLPYNYRVTPKHARIVAEFPTFNLIVRKESAPKFENYLTGEDSLFCRRIQGFIIYSPLVTVYHRRRPLFIKYWKQIGTYGLHRGHLIRLAFLGWLSTWFVYGRNFIKGLTRRKI